MLSQKVYVFCYITFCRFPVGLKSSFASTLSDNVTVLDKACIHAYKKTINHSVYGVFLSLMYRNNSYGTSTCPHRVNIGRIDEVWRWITLQVTVTLLIIVQLTTVYFLSVIFVIPCKSIRASLIILCHFILNGVRTDRWIRPTDLRETTCTSDG